MSDRKIDDHQIDIELELVGFLDHPQRLTSRPADKTADFSIHILWHKISRKQQVINEQHVAAQAAISVFDIGDNTRGHRGRCKLFGH